MLNFIVYLFLLTLFGKPEPGDDEKKDTSRSRFSDNDDFYREG